MIAAHYSVSCCLLHVMTLQATSWRAEAWMLLCLCRCSHQSIVNFRLWTLWMRTRQLSLEKGLCCSFLLQDVTIGNWQADYGPVIPEGDGLRASKSWLAIAGFRHAIWWSFAVIQICVCCSFVVWYGLPFLFSSSPGWLSCMWGCNPCSILDLVVAWRPGITSCLHCLKWFL